MPANRAWPPYETPTSLSNAVVTAAAVLIGPAEEPIVLMPGDYITYPGDELHIFKALEPDTTAVMIMEHI